MASFVARECRITYGTLVIGASEDLQPTTKPVEINKGDDFFVCTFSFVFSVPGLADPGGSFETTLAAIDTALRDREKILLVEYGPGLSRTLLDLGSNTDEQDTALNVRCEWRRTDNSLNTNRSAHYDVVVSGGLPPTDAARTGRRSFDTGVVFDSSRRLNVTFSGEWTRVGADAASVLYLAGIDALTMAYLTAKFDARAFEVVDEAYAPDELDDVLSYTKVFREILVAQTGAATGLLDDPDFTDQTLVITRSRREGAGPQGDAEPLVALTAVLTTRVNAELGWSPPPAGESLTNVGILTLDRLLNDKIVPAMVGALQDAVAGQLVAVLSVSPDFDPTTNQLRVAIEAISKPGGNTLERVIFTQDGSQSNTILRKAYPDGSEKDQPTPSNGANLFGFPLVKVPRAWRFTTAGAVTRRITDQRTLLGSSRFVSGGAGGGGGQQSPAGAGAQGSGGTRVGEESATPAGDNDPVTAIVIGRQFGVRSSIRGLGDLGVTFGVVEVVSVIDLELYDPIVGGGGGGGRSGDATQVRSPAGTTGGGAGSEG